jgi:hypothetical protein
MRNLRRKLGDQHFTLAVEDVAKFCVESVEITASMVPGGRVELPTPAFSGPRSTGELPRHRSSQKIVRAREHRSKGLKKRNQEI